MAMHTATPRTNPSPAWDRAGMLATGLCVLHCLALPLLVPLAAAVGVPALVSPTAERIALVVTLLFASLVLMHGCRHHHHQRAPLALAALGGLLYAAKGQLGEAAEPLMVLTGGVLISAAHAWNLRLCQQCGAGSPTHCH